MEEHTNQEIQGRGKKKREAKMPGFPIILKHNIPEPFNKKKKKAN